MTEKIKPCRKILMGKEADRIRKMPFLKRHEVMQRRAASCIKGARK